MSVEHISDSARVYWDEYIQENNNFFSVTIFTANWISNLKSRAKGREYFEIDIYPKNEWINAELVNLLNNK